MSYRYGLANKRHNRLLQVVDNISPTRDGTYRDLDAQASTKSYQYDAIGNIVVDASECITSIVRSVYGKILKINRTPSTNNPTTKIVYNYDGQGNRINSVTKRTITTGWHYEENLSLLLTL
ncbi:hypothetical protein ACX0G7_16465 [Flavitalea antarctica]